MLRWIVNKIPVWIPSLIVVCAILYATLWPNSYDIDPIFLFPGIDKVIHFVMFLVLSVTLTYDTAKQIFPSALSLKSLIVIFLVSSIFGYVIELLQEAMCMGRSKDYYDLLFDVLGALAGVLMSVKLVRMLLDVYMCKK